MRKDPKSIEKSFALSNRWLFRIGRSVAMVAAALSLLAAFALGAEPAPSADEIMRTNPELYRQIQAGPRLPPKPVDPEEPYPPYPGFLAQPVLKPGQVEDWWENSSYDYSPVYPYLLKHTHLKFSYSDSTGNDDGYAFKGGVYIALRQGRFTNVNGYEIDKKSIVSTDGSLNKRDVQSFEETALYELSPNLFVEGGMYWQRNTLQMIQNRYIPFVGLGSYNVLRNLLDPRKDRLALGLGFGKVRDEYDDMVSDLIGKGSDSFKALYAKADFSHKFTPMLTYKQKFVIKHALDRTTIYGITTIPQGAQQRAIVLGDTRRYDWRWNNSLEFALNQWVGFLLSYEVAYDSNPWPIVLKRDTTFLSGVKFAY